MTTSWLDLNENIPSGSLQIKQEAVELFSLKLAELRPALYAYLGSWLGGDMAAAEDCLQEVAIILWKKHDVAWGLEEFRKYAYKCASFEVLAYRRKIGRRNQHLISMAPDVVDSLVNTIGDCERADSSQPEKRLAALTLCVDSLSEEHRALLDARYKGNSQNVTKLAEQRGCKLDTLYKRLERLRTALHKCITQRLK